MPPRKRLFGIPILIYIAFVVGIPNGFVIPFLNEINSEVTNSYFAIALGEALFLFAIAFMGMIWGFILDWVHRKELTLIVAFDLAALFLIVTSMSINSEVYVLSRFFTGFFLSSAYAYVMIVLTAEYPPGRRIQTFLSFAFTQTATQGISSALAYLLIPILSWRTIIVFYAILLALMSLPIILVRVEVTSNTYAEFIRFLFSETRKFFQIKTNFYLSLQGFFGSFPWGAIGLFFLYAVMEAYSCSFVSASILAISAAGGYIFSFIAAYYLDRLRKRGHLRLVAMFPMFIVFTQMFLFLGVLNWVNAPLGSDGQLSLRELTNPAALIKLISNKHFIVPATMLVLFGFLSILAGPITKNIVADVNPAHRSGSAAMILRFFELLGQTIGLILTGLLIDLTGSFIFGLSMISLSWIICGSLWFKVSEHYQYDAIKPQ